MKRSPLSVQNRSNDRLPYGDSFEASQPEVRPLNPEGATRYPVLSGQVNPISLQAGLTQKDNDRINIDATEINIKPNGQELDTDLPLKRHPGAFNPPTVLVEGADLPPPPEGETDFHIEGIADLQRYPGAEEVKITPKNFHVWSLILNILGLGAFWSPLGILIANYSSDNAPIPAFTFLKSYFWIFIILYLPYFIECWCARSLRFLWHRMKAQKVFAFVTQMKQTKPVWSLHCECYHTETRRVWVRNGKYGGHYETRTYKIVTHSETEEVFIARYEEISPMISEDLFHNELIKIVFGVKIEPGDDASSATFQAQIDAFNARNIRRDLQYRQWMTQQLPGLIEEVIAVHHSNKGWLVHWLWYFLFSFILQLSWVYRIFVEWICVRGEYSFHTHVFSH